MTISTRMTSTLDHDQYSEHVSLTQEEPPHLSENYVSTPSKQSKNAADNSHAKSCPCRALARTSGVATAPRC